MRLETSKETGRRAGLLSAVAMGLLLASAVHADAATVKSITLAGTMRF